MIDTVKYGWSEELLSLLGLANNIVSDPNHVLHNESVLLPSNRQYEGPKFNQVWLKKSFVHQAVLELNKAPKK